MSHKRGQAALEFLTTYGWAFVVILVMIGALAYFGVLDPSRFLPNRCQFPSGLKCGKYTLDSTSTTSDVARFQLSNNLPDDITINQVKYSTDNANTWRDCVKSTNTSSPETDINLTINRGLTKTVNCTMPEGTLKPNTKQKVNFRVVYSQGDTFDSNFANDAFGEIYAEVR